MSLARTRRQQQSGSGTGSESLLVLSSEPAAPPRQPEPDGGQQSRVEHAVLALSTIAIGRIELDAALLAVARIAGTLLAAADGVSVCSIEADRAPLRVTSADFVAELEELQHALSEGPSLAVLAAPVASSSSLGGEAGWPRFGPRAGRLGVHSALAVPLIQQRAVIATISLYSHAKDAFGSQAVAVAQRYAGYAAVAVDNAQVLARARRVTAVLESNSTGQAAIERAVGMLMSRRGLGPAEALALLRGLSQKQNQKLAAVAQQLVDEATQRARRR